MGEGVPLAACGQHREDGVDDFAQGILAGCADGLALASVEGFFEAGLLLVGKVAVISCPVAHRRVRYTQLSFIDRL